MVQGIWQRIQALVSKFHRAQASVQSVEQSGLIHGNPTPQLTGFSTLVVYFKCITSEQEDKQVVGGYEWGVSSTECTLGKEAHN